MPEENFIAKALPVNSITGKAEHTIYSEGPFNLEDIPTSGGHVTVTNAVSGEPYGGIYLRSDFMPE